MAGAAARGGGKGRRPPVVKMHDPSPDGPDRKCSSVRTERFYFGEIEPFRPDWLMIKI